MKSEIKSNIPLNKKSLVENNIIFTYKHMDGFHRRGLKVNLEVDANFIFQMTLKSFENQLATGTTFEFFLKGNLPTQIWNSIHYICSLKNLNKVLKHGYGKYMEDLPEGSFTFKSRNQIIQTQILVIDTEEFQKRANPAEKELIKLNKLITLWIEDLYSTLIKK
ncbi:hypothetical protein [uncultured Dokdonia sp.]|uniref:hypothetical protein n=1 Tax=uncultured Dokdonia sp. TaxID=575653 RepID=UPI002612614B|nr:hypothetical protein [uncultured Dokdonia sp.]